MTGIVGLAPAVTSQCDRSSSSVCLVISCPSDVPLRSPGKRLSSDASSAQTDGKSKVKRSKSQSSPSPGPKKPGRKPSASEQPTPKKARLEDRVSELDLP